MNLEKNNESKDAQIKQLTEEKENLTNTVTDLTN